LIEFISPVSEEWDDMCYIWNNSYLYCGCRWKWRMIIAVNLRYELNPIDLDRDRYNNICFIKFWKVAEVICRLATLVVTLVNKEPTQGMLLSDINGTADIMAAEVGSSSWACTVNRACSWACPYSQSTRVQPNGWHNHPFTACLVLSVPDASDRLVLIKFVKQKTRLKSIMLFDRKLTKQVSTVIDMKIFVPSNFAMPPKLHFIW